MRCETCSVPDHDTCPLVADCDCCADTITQMLTEAT